MTELVPLIQISTPIRQGDMPQVVVRVSDNADVQTVLSIINQVCQQVVPLAQGLATALADQPGTAVAALQQGGMNPQPTYDPQAELPNNYANQYQQAPQQTYVPSQQQFSHGATQYNQQAPQADSGPCWACDKPRNCPDCGGPTVHKTVEARGKTLNIHDCTKGQRHKGIWCQTPIWKSKQQQLLGQGGQLPHGLVLEP